MSSVSAVMHDNSCKTIIMDEKVRDRKFNIIRYVYIVYYMYGIEYRVDFTLLFTFIVVFFPTILKKKKKNVRNVFFIILTSSKKSDH